MKEPPFPTTHVADIAHGTGDAEPWLVRSLWPAAAVGLLGGPQKGGKTWLSLDLARSLGVQRNTRGLRPQESPPFGRSAAPHRRAHPRACADVFGLPTQEKRLRLTALILYPREGIYDSSCGILLVRRTRCDEEGGVKGVLSVDLANTSYGNLGMVFLEETQGSWSVRTLSPRDLCLAGPPSGPQLAARLADACRRLPASILVLDGPQGWKDPDNGLLHSRSCERELNTPAKTGLPGSAKPANYLAFLAFSIDVFQALVARGFELWSGSTAHLLAVESFPSSAWRQLGLPAPEIQRTFAECKGLAER